MLNESKQIRGDLSVTGGGGGGGGGLPNNIEYSKLRID